MSLAPGSSRSVGGFATAKAVLTNAQIKLLVTTPVAIVPAQGVGTLIVGPASGFGYAVIDCNTTAAVYTNAIRPHTAGMNPANVTYSVTWNKNQQQASPYIGTDPVTKKPITLSQSNTVSVTVTYSWDTGLFGVIPVSSTAVAIMSY